MARIGYARVSTIDQDLETQLAKLKSEGCEVIRSERCQAAAVKGARRVRPKPHGWFRSPLQPQRRAISRQSWRRSLS